MSYAALPGLPATPASTTTRPATASGCAGSWETDGASQQQTPAFKTVANALPEHI